MGCITAALILVDTLDSNLLADDDFIASIIIAINLLRQPASRWRGILTVAVTENVARVNCTFSAGLF
jgi:uncharacterized membrane protein (GlpM family)